MAMSTEQEKKDILNRKMICVCPYCNSPVFGRDIGLAEIDLTGIQSFPFYYETIHKEEEKPFRLYLDGQLFVRDIKTFDEF